MSVTLGEAEDLLALVCVQNLGDLPDLFARRVSFSKFPKEFGIPRISWSQCLDVERKRAQEALELIIRDSFLDQSLTFTVLRNSHKGCGMFFGMRMKEAARWRIESV